jgi:BioD-like phosphotransacetylase family protein
MNAFRWAFACTLTLALLAGCRSEPKEPETQPLTTTSQDKIDAARAALSAKGDMLVGEAVAVNEVFASVSGIDAKAADKNKLFDFIDVDSKRVINTGTLHDVSASGRLIIEYDQSGERPPRKGDLCVQLK